MKRDDDRLRHKWLTSRKGTNSHFLKVALAFTPQNYSTENNSNDELISFAMWLRRIGRSDTTGWRWVKLGWLHPINIAGRPYLSREDIQQFRQRAERGEFARPPRGAAARSAKAASRKGTS